MVISLFGLIKQFFSGNKVNFYIGVPEITKFGRDFRLGPTGTRRYRGDRCDTALLLPSLSVSSTSLRSSNYIAILIRSKKLWCLVVRSFVERCRLVLFEVRTIQDAAFIR